MLEDNQLGGGGQAPRPDPAPPSIQDDLARGANLLRAALDYHRRGLCVVPQLTGAKMPCVKWKPYQDERPTVDDLKFWFGRRFPSAGIAIILGPVSDLLVVDVDGEDAHDALVDRLRLAPSAPTVLSGSLKPFRYHLYFKHPGGATQAKYNPWHPQLEFRGHRGIVVAPPSLHKSGNTYSWAEGRSLDDLTPPELPAPIRAALEAKARVRAHTDPGATVLEPLPTDEEERRARNVGFLFDLCEKTQDFLLGRYAAEPNWNTNLFLAACDMCGSDYPLDEAMPLLRGARPWTTQDAEVAERTIRSAYSEERQSARRVTARRSRGTFTIRVSRHLDDNIKE